MRRFLSFSCEGARLAATLDEGAQKTGLLIVSGGNEIRAGAHAGMAMLAGHIAARGHPVFRYDRRGVGDSEGENKGFEASAPDIAAAAAAFRAQCPHLERVAAFGNCDAATALAFFHADAGIDRLVIANPWVIEQPDEGEGVAAPPPSAIRARYIERLKDPRSIADLLSGRIDLGKLVRGLGEAVRKEEPSGLSARLGEALGRIGIAVDILLAQRDTTARAYLAAHVSPAFAAARRNDRIRLERYPTASHGFADAKSKAWLFERIEKALAQE